MTELTKELINAPEGIPLTVTQHEENPHIAQIHVPTEGYVNEMNVVLAHNSDVHLHIAWWDTGNGYVTNVYTDK